MTFIEIFIYGLLQGIAEFLPVSSSGHIVVAQKFFGRVSQDLSLNIAVHMGTLLTIFIYYRQQWFNLFQGLFKRETVAMGEAKLIILATLPTGVIGLAVKKYGGWVLTSPLVAGVGFLVTGFVLFSESKVKEPKEQSTGKSHGGAGPGKVFWYHALLLGAVQGLAVLPGLSRSGLTIVSGLWLGLGRENSARLSFFISVPAILGAALLEVLEGFPSSGGWDLFLAAAVSFGVGLLAISMVVGLTHKNRLSTFRWYLWPLGLGVTFLALGF